MARKKKELDKLTLENSLALAAGMSYGKWKALQPRVPIEPKKPAEGYTEHTCEHCGCKFVRYDKVAVKFCGDRCREASYKAKREEAQEQKK